MKIYYIKAIGTKVPFKIWKCDWSIAKAIRIGFGFGFIEIQYAAKW